MRTHLASNKASPRSICAAGTLRRAARSIARIYDSRLAVVGLTTTQFSILRRLAETKQPVPLMELANELVFERTSLYRALGPLRRQRLVALEQGPGRAKAVTLTALGVKKVAVATPYWRRAQQDFLDEFGVGAWGSLAGELTAVIHASRSMTVDERALPTASE